MLDCIVDALLDTIKVIPFLLLAFFIIELIEHKLDSQKIIKFSNKKGPILGSLLGIIPQCGFSTLATNLYITRIISLGTLISIYLSCSDETLLILISEKANLNLIIGIIAIKILIGFICGFIIDLLIKPQTHGNYHICENEHCHCEKSYIKSSIYHTLKISSFIFIINIILNSIFEFGLENYLTNLFLNNKIAGPLLCSLIGLIPNCASSVILTKLYLVNSITFGSLMAGLLTNSGLGLLILYKSNKNLKENIFITLLVYLIGITFGLLINCF